MDPDPERRHALTFVTSIVNSLHDHNIQNYHLDAITCNQDRSAVLLVSGIPDWQREEARGVLDMYGAVSDLRAGFIVADRKGGA